MTHTYTREQVAQTVRQISLMPIDTPEQRIERDLASHRHQLRLALSDLLEGTEKRLADVEEQTTIRCCANLQSLQFAFLAVQSAWVAAETLETRLQNERVGR